MIKWPLVMEQSLNHQHQDCEPNPSLLSNNNNYYYYCHTRTCHMRHTTTLHVHVQYIHVCVHVHIWYTCSSSILVLTWNLVLSHANCWKWTIALSTFLCPPGTRHTAPNISRAEGRGRGVREELYILWFVIIIVLLLLCLSQTL